MAINPDIVNILNIVELQQATSIQDTDLLVLGQGIYARKSTVLELYQKFGIDVISTNLNELTNVVNDLVIDSADNVKFVPQILSAPQQQTARNNIDVYSKTEVIDAIATATAPKTKGFFEHILTAADIANTIMDFALPNTPDPNEWDFLYINSGAVSPLTYTVNGNILSIDTTKLAYPVQAGRRVTFRYMY